MFVTLTRESGRPILVNLATVQTMADLIVREPHSANVVAGDPITCIQFNGKEKLWVQESTAEILEKEVAATVDFNEAFNDLSPEGTGDCDQCDCQHAVADVGIHPEG